MAEFKEIRIAFRDGKYVASAMVAPHTGRCGFGATPLEALQAFLSTPEQPSLRARLKDWERAEFRSYAENNALSILLQSMVDRIEQLEAGRV